MMKRHVISLLTIGMLAGSSIVSASDYSLTVEQERLIAALLTAPKSAPGIGIGVPSGFAASGGQPFVSVGGTTTEDSDGDRDYDGSASVGVGLGDANELLALELQANIISLTNNGDDSGFGEQGSFSAKISRNFASTFGVAVGAENLATWGDGLDSTDPSVYLAVTKVTSLSDDPLNPFPLTLTAGIGNERFRDVSDSKKDGSVGFFASAAIAVHQQAGLIVDYNGNYFSAGLSFVPLKQYPLTVTLSMVNLNSVDSTDGGTFTGDPEFGGSIGYSW